MSLYISAREELQVRCPGKAEAGSNGELLSRMCAEHLENEESVFQQVILLGPAMVFSKL